MPIYRGAPQVDELLQIRLRSTWFVLCRVRHRKSPSGEHSAPAIVQSSLPGPAGNGTARPYARRGKTLTWLSYGSRLRENECIAWVELLVGHQNVVNIIWIGWSADSIPQNLEDVLDPRSKLPARGWGSCDLGLRGRGLCSSVQARERGRLYGHDSCWVDRKRYLLC